MYGNVHFWIIVHMFTTVMYFTYSWTWECQVGLSWDYFLFVRAPISISMLGLNVLLLMFLLFWYMYKLSFSMNNWWLCNSLKSFFFPMRLLSPLSLWNMPVWPWIQKYVILHLWSKISATFDALACNVQRSFCLVASWIVHLNAAVCSTYWTCL
jgi:hypothetical protein